MNLFENKRWPNKLSSNYVKLKVRDIMYKEIINVYKNDTLDQVKKFLGGKELIIVLS
jgi:predicted transcriptional regulator